MTEIEIEAIAALRKLANAVIGYRCSGERSFDPVNRALIDADATLRLSGVMGIEAQLAELKKREHK